MTNAEQFLELYKELEAIVANTYGARKEGGSVAKLGRRPEFRSISAELDYIRDVRNLLSHRPRISGEYVVEPSDAMVKLLQDVIRKVQSPAIAGNIMITLPGVLRCSKAELVLPVVRKMYDRNISHVPIVENGLVIGAFSNSTFIHCTISKDYTINEETVFADLGRELDLENHEAEQFQFTEKRTPIDELSDIFEEGSRQGRKVGLIFVTEHGKQSEKLLGIITAWDVAGAY